MRFLPKHISEKLIAMGCKSEGGFGYGGLEPGHADIPVHFLDDVSAFSLEDIVGTNSQAKENCKIIWGDKSCFTGDSGVIEYQYSCPVCSGNEEVQEAYIYHRHALIDSSDWVKYIGEALEGK